MTKEYRKVVITYWEKRRIWFNLILLAMLLLTWPLSQGFTAGIDDKVPASLLNPLVIAHLAISFLLCNVCYSLVYTLEFFFYSSNQESFWPSAGRTLIFLSGCIFVVLAAGPHFSELERQLADFPRKERSTTTEERISQ